MLIQEKSSMCWRCVDRVWKSLPVSRYLPAWPRSMHVPAVAAALVRVYGMWLTAPLSYRSGPRIASGRDAADTSFLSSDGALLTACTR
jgi:hypothetical protein